MRITIHRNPGYNVKSVLIILAISFFSLSAASQDIKTEILWDHYGVPHIYGRNTREMYYAYGWAQMHNHANLILKLYGQARGRAAEYWGEDYLRSDMKMRLFKVPEQAVRVYETQGPGYKDYLDAFVNGMNDYATAHPGAIGEDVRQVLPVTVFDVMAHMIRVTSLEFLAAEDIYMADKQAEKGSNAIAIAPSKSASGHAMLVINPHLPWDDYFIWFEAHLNTAGINIYGIALVGMPSITMGFNENLGWAHTVNPLDASDRYELSLKDDGYLLDGHTVPFEINSVLIRVRQHDGTIVDKPVIFKYSVQGPVVGENDTKAYAVRIAGFENTRIFEQYHRMAVSHDFAGFESALKLMQSSMFNIIYADRQGNIFYLFNGNIPVRKSGDYNFWRGTVDGSKSALVWKNTHPFRDLPSVLNPPSGFIQNCNDPPWTCTSPPVLDPKDFPPYMAPQGMPLRPQHAMNMIRDNPSVTYTQLLDYKLNTGMEAADRFLDDLLAAASQYPDSIILKATEILRNWDGRTERDSRGAVLFACWWDKVRSDLFETPWDAAHPSTTPDGIRDPKRAVELLTLAAEEVIKKYGSLDVAWGDVYRFRINGLDLPANGGPGNYGIFRTIYFKDEKDNTKSAIAGETFVAVTEFGDRVSAKVLLSYGNASQPGSEHTGDQLEMLSDKKMRQALIYRSDVLDQVEETEILPCMDTDTSTISKF